MGNTYFYNKAKTNANSITWKDIFSECRKKHSKKELEYALQAGTSFNTATESDMLAKWQKPWMFYPLLKGGVVLWVFIYLLYFIILAISGPSNSLHNMTIIIPPMIMPMIILFFLWELNIPKNISVYELLAYFLIGGFLTFGVTSIMLAIIPSGPGIFSASYAAFREEPAKLIPAVIFMIYFMNGRKKKLYGITGLVIGAAVGAGFGIFESISYAFNSSGSGIQGIVINQVMRGVFSLGGHILYAAPYSAALALAVRKKGKLTWSCFADRDFLITFISAVVLHFIWNASFGGVFLMYAKYIIIIVVLWLILLYILRKCLNEMVSIGTYHSGSGYSMGGTAQANASVAASIQVVCVAGALRGAIWQSAGSEVLYMGRESGNQFRFPPSTAGISRFHCSIQRTQQGWTLIDTNSSYGTYVNGGNKIVPGIEHVLRDGDIIYIASSENAFQVRIY